MRKVSIDSIPHGSKLAKDIFSFDGRILLSAGVQIREDFLARLRLNNIVDLYIEDEVSEGVVVRDVIKNETRQEAKQLVKNLSENVVFSSAINNPKLLEVVSDMIDELLNNEDIIINLADMRTVDDYTFSHSVNVCVYSLITGIGLGYNRNRLKDLGVGALLHDIGKLRIPDKLLKKPSQLTVEEFEEIKKHTLYGYEILKNKKNISMISAFIAFAHHERIDGSGYPLQIRGENIHQCAKVVAVADVFDALTSDRVYRKKLRPHEVVEYITSLGSHHFDPEIVGGFVKFVALYPVGTGVVLNTNEKALVVKVNKNAPTRPIVRLVLNKHNEKIPDFPEVDLSKKVTLQIVGVCEL